jgi:hypothetical protein
MKAGCPTCAENGDPASCTCSRNCMFPSCQWKVQALVVSPRIKQDKPATPTLSAPKPLGPHSHTPPDYGPDNCGCAACALYQGFARNNPKDWPDPIEHHNEGYHYWGDHIYTRPMMPPWPSTPREDKKEDKKPLKTEVQATL